MLPLTSATTARSLPHPRTRSTLSWSQHEVYYCPASKTNAQVEASGDDPTWSSRGHHPWLLWCRSPLASSSTAASCGLVKWATKGLMPIKPQVALTYDVEIQPGTAVHL